MCGNSYLTASLKIDRPDVNVGDVARAVHREAAGLVHPRVRRDHHQGAQQPDQRDRHPRPEVRPRRTSGSGCRSRLVGMGGALMVVGELVDRPPGGFTMDSPGTVNESNVLVGDLQQRRQVRVPAHVLRRGAGVPPGSSWPRLTRWAMLRGRRGARCRRLRLLLPFTIASIAIPDPDGHRRLHRAGIYDDQPIKFAALEINTATGPDKPEILLGHLNEDGKVAGPGRSPGWPRWLSDPSTGTNTVVQGLDSVPAEDRPTAGAPTPSTWPGTSWSGSGRRLSSSPSGLDPLVAPARAAGRDALVLRARGHRARRPPSLRSRPAGSSPRSGASRGSSTRSCAPRTR